MLSLYVVIDHTETITLLENIICEALLTLAYWMKAMRSTFSAVKQKVQIYMIWEERMRVSQVNMCKFWCHLWKQSSINSVSLWIATCCNYVGHQRHFHCWILNLDMKLNWSNYFAECMWSEIVYKKFISSVLLIVLHPYISLLHQE